MDTANQWAWVVSGVWGDLCVFVVVFFGLTSLPLLVLGSDFVVEGSFMHGSDHEATSWEATY